MLPTAADLIAALKLAPHPEGGAFAETFRHADQVPVRGGRSLATAIYFLLRAGERSARHRVASAEIWLFHGGDALSLRQVSPEGQRREDLLGLDLARGARPQIVVPADYWQTASPAPGGAHGFTLVSCVVAPGFDFQDFEMVDEATLRARFPGI